MSFRISAPQAEHISIQANQGQPLHFDFDASAANFERSGDNLTVSFEDGGQVVLEGFFAPPQGEDLPSFVLSDGQEVTASAFLRAVDPGFDLTTAAGRTNSAAASGGAGDYADSAGDLLGSVDRLGSLGTDQWGTSREASEPPVTTGAFTASPAAGDSGAAVPPSGNGQDPDPASYHTRLIVTDTADNTFTFQAMDENGILITDGSVIEAAFEGNGKYFIITDIAADGMITVQLTAEGLAALQSGDYAGDMLVISINGNAYRMPLIINDSQAYDYAPEEAKAGLGPDLKAEWYASDSSTVSGAEITLGGSHYNRVDIDKSGTGTLEGAVNTSIDVTASDQSHVFVTAQSDTGTARAVGTNGGNSSITGGSRSDISVSAETHGQNQYAYGTFTQNGRTAIDGNTVSIAAANTASGGAIGVYGTGASAGSVTDIHADGHLTITASSEESLRAPFSMVSGAMADYKAVITLKTGPGGKLVVESTLADTDEYTYSAEKGGSFKVTGVSARAGGRLTMESSDIDVSAEVDATSEHGTAAAVYSGWTYQGQVSDVTINGLHDVDNTMTFSAKAADAAVGIIGTNSGNVRVQGRNGNDLVSVRAEAGSGSAIGVAAQANDGLGGSKVYLDGGAGQDTLNIGARFTGTAYGGSLENFEAPRGAIGVAAAWQQGWGNDEHGAAQVRINNFETINITADATGSTGSAMGIFTRSAYQGAPGVYIDTNDKALELNVTARADDPAKAHSIYNFGGTVDIKGGSAAGSSDIINLTGHMTATGSGASNVITTGGGDDSVTLTGNMNAVWGANSINTGRGNDTIAVSGGMNAGDGSFTGHNLINAGDGNNTVSLGGNMAAKGNGAAASSSNTVKSGSGQDAVTVTGQIYASGGGKNVIDTGVNDPGTGADSVTVNGGIVAAGNHSQNVITSDVVTVKSAAGNDAGSSASGLWAHDGGANTVHGSEVTIEAASDTGPALGLWAVNGGANLIEGTTGHGITVTLTAQTGALGNAWAMLAEGASNTIQGTSVNGTADHITITGGLYASNNGLNAVITGSGDDKVGISGDISGDNNGSGYGNILNTGDGRDVIFLDGAVQNGSFHLDAGDGYDTLVLKATDWSEFQIRYNDWLNDNFAAMNVEAVHVDLGHGDQSFVNEMLDYFSTLAPDASLTYSYGGTLYLDGYAGESGDSVLHLGDLLDTLDSSFNGLDMSGHQNNHLFVDSGSLNSHPGDSGPMAVNGDAGDSVTLFGNAGDWSRNTADHGDYTAWTNNDGQELLIHNDILVNFGG